MSANGAILPVKTTAKCWRVETTPCRSFDHTVFVGEQVWSYNGIACRAADGTWQEVGSRSNGQFVASVESKETSSRPTSSPKARSSASSGATEVHLVREAGTFRVPVLINGVIELNFTLDSGASDVLIPADVVMTLLRIGTLNKRAISWAPRHTSWRMALRFHLRRSAYGC